MHWLFCPTCNPFALRRRRKFVADVRAEGHAAFFASAVKQAVADRKQRVEEPTWRLDRR